MHVISGGQTGVDRAALDAALELGLACGGWCPRGRLAEDGPLPQRYPLRETPTGDYAQRTHWNVRDSDGTLILTRGRPSGGTGLTARLAERLGRPVLVVDLAMRPKPTPAETAAWIAHHRIAKLNVAGPRQSGARGIYEEARAFLLALLNPTGTHADTPDARP